MKKLLLAPFAALAGLMVSNGAFAQATPAATVADVVTGIGNQVTPIGAIGVAVLSVVVAIAAYKWVKRAI